MTIEIRHDLDEIKVQSFLVLLRVLEEPKYNRFTMNEDPGLGIILKMGEEAFDKKAFPTLSSKPVEGDFVYFDAYESVGTFIFKQGQRVKFHNSPCVFLPDTSIVAIVGDSKWKDKLLEDYKDVEGVKVSA